MNLQHVVNAANIRHEEIAKRTGQSRRYVTAQIRGDRELLPKTWRAIILLAEANFARLLAASGVERPEATLEETRRQWGAFVAQAQRLRDRAGTPDAREAWQREVERLEALTAQLEEVTATW